MGMQKFRYKQFHYPPIAKSGFRGDPMVAEIKIDNDNKIILRTLTGEIYKAQALKLVQNVSLSVKLNRGYSILVDIRDTSYHPKMGDLLEIV